jgi:hypothetical protein
MPIVTLELAAVAEAGGLAMLSALRAPTPYLVDTLEKAASCTAMPFVEYNSQRRS